ncbi:MAG: DUF4860 domain-containing protein [Clostridiaceae bacterium]|jgi:hypothetical protein|nr:DUF4860 domain-containing protein [Clostridiaceae bacterium]
MSCPMWRSLGSKGFIAKKGRLSRRGSVSAETIATLLLLLALGIGIFVLALSSTSAYTRLYEGKSLSSELRVALSFIQMKIRQNDLKDAIRVEDNPVNGEPAIVIREVHSGEVYETWIYQDGGILREAIMPEGMPPSNEYSFEITEVDGFSVKMEGNLLDISVWLDREDGRFGRESCVTLRSE